MDDTNVKLSIDLGNKVLQHFNKISHSVALTIDIGPNVMLTIKYIAGSLIICKSIDFISNLVMMSSGNKRKKD